MAIFCSSCGAEQPDSANRCSECQAQITRVRESPEKRNGVFQYVIAVVCLIYLINPTAGVLELIPDVVPILGNLDEAAATAGLLAALSNLGWIPWRRR